MPLFVPTSLAEGVPCNCPVVVLNVAHAGLLVIENVNGSPSGSLAVGVNEYAVPAVADVAGVPEITGGLFGAAFTTIEKAGSDADALPSLTPITMPLFVPTSLAAGVPCNRPVVVLNVAHAGLLVIENVNESPSGSLAVGWNE